MTKRKVFSILFTVFHEYKKILACRVSIMSLKVRRFERYWKKQGRKDAFTWVYRYLRLHQELLADSVYQNLYDYHRNTLIAYLKKDIKNSNLDDTQLGEFIDVCSDFYNQCFPDRTEKYKLVVEFLYKMEKNTPEGGIP